VLRECLSRRPKGLPHRRCAGIDWHQTEQCLIDKMRVVNEGFSKKKNPSDGCPSEGIIVEVWVGMMGKASSNVASPKALLG